MLGDLPPDEFRAAMHRVADMVADYLEGVERYPVVPDIEPGAVGELLPASPPEHGEPLEQQLADYRELIEPRTTHWNHPGFLAYFSSSGSAPGILGETLAAGLSVNTMLWKSSPAGTELEERVCDWLRQMLALPDGFRGHINDTASMSTFLALAAAREKNPALNVRRLGMAGRTDLPALRVYASEEVHSSIDKSMIGLGLGLENLRRIPCDESFRLDPEALARAIREDRERGHLPLAVVATVGTTSTTSVDPVAEVVAICRRECLWLHVDAAWAGSAAICPEYRRLMEGIEEADSMVVNPHKWMFTPMDCSVLFMRDIEDLRRAFSLVPAYLETTEQETALNLMDLGVQLGRRFRALKLWMVIRTFGVEGLRARIREHCRLGRALAEEIESTTGFEVMAPVPFSTVCFRADPSALAGAATVRVSGEDIDAFNERLLAAVNREGPVFLSQTRLRGRYALRVAVCQLRTREEHVRQAWRLVCEQASRLAAES